MRSNLALELLLIASALWFVTASLLMLIVPDRVADHFKRSRLWRWYLRVFFSIEGASAIDARRLRLRIQGVIGAIFSVFLLYALYTQLAS